MTSRPDLLGRAAARVATRAAEAGLRRLQATHHAGAGFIAIGNRRLLNFASNDYLALADHAAVRAAAIECIAREGVGATAAHLLGGHRREHHALEAALAEWTQRPAVLLFSTGYHANLGVLGALLGPQDLCVQDKLDHACLVDGAAIAGCELRRYPHGDVVAAGRQLAARPDAGAMLATDGVFSMDGTVAPLRELAELCARQRALLHVDDAHGIGVLGPDGRGSIAEAGLTLAQAPILMATMGKSLGTFGAFVAGSVDLIEALVQFARTFVFTTALPPVLAAAALAATRVAQHEGWRRDKLNTLIAHFRRGASARGIRLLDSRTPIQPVIVGDSKAALDAARSLSERGFYLPAVRPPSVPQGSARLRVTLTAAHAETDVERLLDALAEVLDAHHVVSGIEPERDARRAGRESRTRSVRVRNRR